MQATGYLDRPQRHPGFLAAAIVLHVGIVGAILAYHPEVLRGDKGGIPLIPIIPDRPPPPQPEDNETKQRTTSDPQPLPQPDHSRTVVDDPVADAWPSLPPEPPVRQGTGDGGGTQVLQPPEPVLTAADIDPRFAGALQPPYPPALIRAGIEGNVTVRIQVGPDGRVMAVEPVRADDPAFFASTRDWALKRWRFRPATRDGIPVAVWIIKTVRFQIAR